MGTQDDVIAKIREKKTVFDGLVAGRDALEAKLNEARAATSMSDTNAKIDEALGLLDAFVDSKAQTSPVVENTAAAAEVPASAPDGAMADGQ